MFIKVDAGQLEWRVILELSRDEVGIEELLKKEDVHSKNQAAWILPSRLIAKIFLFRTIFRGSGWSFANDPDFMHVSADAKFWDGMNEKFFSKYQGIDKTHKKWGDYVLKGLPIEGPLGRSWFVELRRNERTGELKIPWPTLTNYPVQGTGADVMMVARVSAYNRIKKLGIPCDWIATVHDDIKVDTKEKYVQPIVNIFHEVFDDIPKNLKNIFGYDWKVPMTCEATMGMNFKDMEVVARNA
jgi:DNA polymerase-1